MASCSISRSLMLKTLFTAFPGESTVILNVFACNAIGEITKVISALNVEMRFSPHTSPRHNTTTQTTGSSSHSFSS